MTKSIDAPQIGNIPVPAGILATPIAETPSAPPALKNDLGVTTTRQDKQAGTNIARINPPVIDTPVMDPDTAIIVMMSMSDKLNTLDVKNSLASLKSKNEFRKTISEEKIKLLVKNIEEVKKQQETKKSQQVGEDVGLGMGTAGAVLGLIGAIFLAMVTFGGGGLAVAAAVVGLVMSSLDVGTRIAEATGATYLDADKNEKPLDITLGGMVKRITEQIVHDDKDFPPGSTPENREQKIAEIVMGMTIFLSVLVAAATIACSAGSMHLAAKAAKDIVGKGIDGAKTVISSLSQQQARFAGNITQILQISAEFTEAVSMVTSGAYGIQLAFNTFDIKELDVQKKQFDNSINLLNDQISTNQDNLKFRVETSSKNYEDFAGVLANCYNSQSKTTLSV